ncbi:hypothetical protein CCACVL1_05906 [Corchorus capsularis]|uniref:Uncharacterized protein n=1 Tax=Corchorus capsularis TaxID=210143 RepID=A0A1R3JII8_COCAP|nr:hypothetical protein CCACVL1_05906 [Corchorus capsularis]
MVRFIRQEVEENAHQISVSAEEDMIPQKLEVIVVQDYSGVSYRENKE